MRGMFGGADPSALAAASQRGACPAPDSPNGPAAEPPEPEPQRTPPTLRVERAALRSGTLTAAPRRAPQTDAHEIEGACRAGSLSSHPVAWLEVIDAQRLRIAVQLEERSARRIALRAEGGATRCLRVREGSASMSRALSPGRYELLTDLGGPGRFAVVVSRAR